MSIYNSVSTITKWEIAPGIDTSTWPSMRDVILLRQFLLKNIPVELINMIFDLAGYWPHITCRSRKPSMISSPLQGSLAPDPAHWSARQLARGPPQVPGYLLRSPPLGVQMKRSATLAKIVPQSLHRHIFSGSSSTHCWLPPQTKQPARMIIFEKVCAGIAHSCWRLCEVSILRNRSEKDDSPSPINLPAVPTKEGQRKRPKVFSILPRRRKASISDSNKCIVMQKQSWTTHRNSIKWRYSGDHENAHPTDWQGVKLNAPGTNPWDMKDESPTITEFMRVLQAGDSIGLWVPAGCGYPDFVDEVRMHVFWAV